MSAEIITKEDLDEFEKRIIDKIDSLFGRKIKEQPKWLKSYQVKNLLKISPNTLQKLRTDGTLRPTKIGGVFYYNYEEILKIFDRPNEV
ncbi:MAG TPA: helix-turn-helix domain-containing protein [Mucilaginibacter sp.]|jgi:hypothetical protein|nr:helix-turn-helix domain-containing protein [Mucilaginibacter sp.]